MMFLLIPANMYLKKDWGKSWKYTKLHFLDKYFVGRNIANWNQPEIYLTCCFLERIDQWIKVLHYNWKDVGSNLIRWSVRPRDCVQILLLILSEFKQIWLQFPLKFLRNQWFPRNLWSLRDPATLWGSWWA